MADRFSPHTGFSWLKPFLIIAFSALVAAGCKTTVSVPGGMPAPPGGMPAPPSGGMPSPGGGMPSPPSPPGGQTGGESSPSGSESGESGGESSPSGSESGESGPQMPGGEVGSFPSEETMGPPPMPSEMGGGSGTDDQTLESGPTASTGGDGDGDSESEWDDESASNDSECGDTGGLPGGVGGMGQAGECVGGGGGGSSSSESSDSSAASGGGSQSADSSVQGTGGAGQVGEFPSESDAERAARLGRELDESIGGFDEVLMEEQQEISSVGRNTEGFGEGVEGDGGISLGEQGMSTGGITVANTAGGAVGSSPIDELSTEEIRSRTPEDIPVTADDDIIARQLREAALAEEDPELRDRLWEEYRKYRGL